MSYDADDPLDLLGKKSSVAHAPKFAGSKRMLTGDVRVATAAGQKLQLIDVEYERPQALMLSCQVLPTNQFYNEGQSNSAIWRVDTGLDRSPLLTQDTFTSGRFSRVVVARSLSVVAESVTGLSVFPHTIQAVVVPIDVSCDVGNLNALIAGSPGERPNVGWTVSVPQTAVLGAEDSMEAYLDAQQAQAYLFGRSLRRGFSCFNNTAVDMFLLLGSRGVGTAASAFTVKIVAGGYYEAPYGYAGYVGFWFSAAGAGTAYFSSYGVG